MDTEKESGNELTQGKSQVWACFESTAQQSTDVTTGLTIRTKEASCKLCKSKFAIKKGNTSNLWSHLERNHISKYTELATTKMQVSRKVRNDNTCSNQPTIKSIMMKNTPYAKQSAEYRSRTEAIVTYIASNGRPLSTVDSPQFVKMIKTFDPRYTVPSRRTVTDQELPKLYLTLKSKIQAAIDLNKNSMIPMFSFTTDLWSSCTMEPYISLTIHFINIDMELQRFTLETKYIPDRHTGVNLALAVEELLRCWDLKLSDAAAITTDSAANMIKMADEAQMLRIPCFGHVLHNAIGKAMSSSDVERTSPKLKRIVAYFHQSHSRQKRLETEQRKSEKKERTLHGPCPTRWGSVFEMYKGIKDNLAEIKRVVVEDTADLVTTPDDEKVVDSVVEAFEPLNLLTDGLSGDKEVSSSSVLPMVRLIKSLQYRPLANNSAREYRNDVFNYIEEKYARCCMLRLFIYNPHFNIYVFLVTSCSLLHPALFYCLLFISS